MSLYTVTNSLLGIKPKVWTEEGVLCARTSLPMQVLLMFSHVRRVRIDAQARRIDIYTRWLWFIRRRRQIPFERVAWINYSISSFGTGWTFCSDEGFGRTDEVDLYRVGLALQNPPKKNVHLFTFAGEGSVETGLRGVLFGNDSIVDMRGDQAEAASDFVSVLRRLLACGVNGPLGGAAKEPCDDGDMQTVVYKCTECGRPSPPTLTRCRHCQGPVKPLIQ